jgi:DNA-binding GntR family transcriptional regulator
VAVINPLTPASNQGLRQIVYEKLKDAIVSGVIKPGSKLSEIDLAEQLAVSRTPVREAIRQLAQTGLVTLTPRRGAYVTLPTEKDASDLYELRMALEILAVADAGKHIPKEELLRFREIFQAMTDHTSHEQYVTEDRAFHQLIYTHCSNHFLSRTLVNISDLINLCRPYSIERDPITNFAGGHVAIIEALLEGKEDRAMDEMRRHITVSKEGLLGYLRNRHREGSKTFR